MRAAKERVYSALASSEALADLVAERIYHSHPPERPTLPLITYSEIVTTGERAEGRLYFRRPRMEVRGWGGDIEDIEEAIIEALETVPGAVHISTLPLWDAELAVETVAVEYRLLVKV